MATSPAPTLTVVGNDSYTPPKMDFKGAWQALKALMADKEDTAQVFKIMGCLTGKSLWKKYQQFAKTEVGSRVLAENIDLLDTLADRDALAALPEGTLGRVYLDFMIREGISAEGLAEASDGRYEQLTHDGLQRYAIRSRDMHDLWHVVSGFGRDGLGEICVVAFSYPQSGSHGFGAIALMGLVNMMKEYPKRGTWKAVWQAYRMGKKAAWLPGQDWEKLLTLPYEEVREMLNLSDPTYYAALDDIIANTRPEAIAAKNEELKAA